MPDRIWLRWSATLAVGWALASCLAQAQAPHLASQGIEEETRQNAASPCLEPPPLVSWDEYQGPFQKGVGTLARTLERKSASSPHYKPGTLLCSLDTKGKFILFVHDAFDPLSFLTAGFKAGFDQAENRDPTFGQGAQGWGKRFGAAMGDQTSVRFFADFVYPTIFSEDPRYYRLGHGSAKKRLVHAIEHTFVAHRDDGSHVFNYSEWMGATTGVVLGNAFHPGNERGVGPAAGRVGYAVLSDMGFDVVREFWPEIARKMRMPFRNRNLPGTVPPAAPLNPKATAGDSQIP